LVQRYLHCPENLGTALTGHADFAATVPGREDRPATIPTTGDDAGPVTNLHLRHLPVPEPARGWVRIKVEAFG
jgi:hypothetical protein